VSNVHDVSNGIGSGGNPFLVEGVVHSLSPLGLHLPDLKPACSVPSLNDVLQQREPIGLDAIESVALMDRFDSKFVVPTDWLVDVVLAMPQHDVLTIEKQVSTRYNNLYFDTPEGRCFEDHVRGRSTRFKVRVRQYDNTGVAFLEVKKRDVHGKTTKARLVRGQDQAWDAPLTSRDRAFLVQHVPFASSLRPTMQSSFERFTLAHLASGERITFDTNLAFVNPVAEDGWVRPCSHLAVVEWKQHVINHQGSLIQAFRSQAGRRGPLGRALRVSKFVLGSAQLSPERHVRTYRAALRDIQRAEYYASNPTFAPQSLLR
jgi:hypothetical protein